MGLTRADVVVDLGTEEVERTVEDVVLELEVVEEVFDVGAGVEVESKVEVEVEDEDEDLATGGGGA
jgi:hypothetical protein